MGIAATFAMLGALFFWFPKMFGRSLDERLGKIHFWITFVGVYCVFMPMHWLGLISHLNLSGAKSAHARHLHHVRYSIVRHHRNSGNYCRSRDIPRQLRKKPAKTQRSRREKSLARHHSRMVASVAPAARKFHGRRTGGLSWSLRIPRMQMEHRAHEDFALQFVPTDSTPPALPGGKDPGLQPLPPYARRGGVVRRSLDRRARLPKRERARRNPHQGRRTMPGTHVVDDIELIIEDIGGGGGNKPPAA